MKYENQSVLDKTNVEIGKTYLLGELPAGIAFQLGRGLYTTVTHPKYNLVVRNCAAAPAEVWNITLKRSHRVAYRQKVKVMGKG